MNKYNKPFITGHNHKLQGQLRNPAERMLPLPKSQTGPHSATAINTYPPSSS